MIRLSKVAAKYCVPIEPEMNEAGAEFHMQYNAKIQYFDAGGE